MTLDEAKKLENGVYYIRWVGEPIGGSVAAVGRDEQGIPWIAPTNWLHPVEEKTHLTSMADVWLNVESAELLTTQRIINEP